MTMREATADSPNDSAEPAAERDLSSLARLLHYAKCEADSLGQMDAVALIDAAILSLKVEDSAHAAAVVDPSPAGADRLRNVPSDQPARTYNRKFC
jgi:hypothetical protein